VRGCLDHVQKLLNLAVDECRRFAFGPRKLLGLDFPGRIHGEHSFFGEPREQHPDGGHVLFDRGRLGLLRAPVHRNRATVVRVSVLVADKPGSWEVVFKTERQKTPPVEILFLNMLSATILGEIRKSL
jgi:hypothetical protein